MDTSAVDSERCRMWAKLIGEDYFDMNKNEKKKAKLAYCKERNTMPHQVVEDFDCCDEVEIKAIPSTCWTEYSVDAKAYVPMAKKGNNTMYYPQTPQTYTNEQNARAHLENRMYTIRDEKDMDLQRFFGLMDDKPPSTAEELVQRVKDGNYVLREKSEYRESFRDRVRWRSPDKKEDHEGYRAANDTLAKDMQDVEDIIAVLDVKDGLTALKQFEAKTYH